MNLRIITSLSLLFFVTSCFFQREKPINLALKHYNDSGPELNVMDYFNGNLEGWGFIENNEGVILKRFTTTIKGEWDGNKGIIKRKFIFGDNQSDSTIWLITANENNLSAVGHEVIGTARGQQYKGLAQLNYYLEKSIDGIREKTGVIETTYNIDGKSSISVLEFKIANKKAGRMIMSLCKVQNDDSLKKKEDENFDPSSFDLYF